MQLALLCVVGAALFAVMRRIIFLRGCGCPAPARRLYMRAAFSLGLAAYAAMAAQELILLLDGRFRGQKPCHPLYNLEYHTLFDKYNRHDRDEKYVRDGGNHQNYDYYFLQ